MSQWTLVYKGIGVLFLAIRFVS